MAVRQSRMPRLRGLPDTMPDEGAVTIELEDGVPVFRASSGVLARIESLLSKQRDSGLTQSEEDEFDRYEEVDDYLSFVNRMLRDLALADLDGS